MDFFRREMAALNQNDNKYLNILERAGEIESSYNNGDFFATSKSVSNFLLTEVYFEAYKQVKELKSAPITSALENFGRLVTGVNSTVNDDFASALAKAKKIKGEEKNYKFDARLEIAIRIVFGYFIGLMIDLAKVFVGNTDFYCIKTNARVIREINDGWNTFDVNYKQLGVTA